MQIANNSVVSFHYKLTNEEGTVLDTSEGREAFAYLQGAGMIVPGLEEQMEGKKAGDKFDAKVEPEKGYGMPNPEMVQNVPLDTFGGQKVEPGMQFSAGEQGELGVFTVIEVSETNVKLDGNHPLAGVALNFAIEVTDVREATEEELAHGHVHGPDGHEH
jgi:FKBP-type peptidyl-prolyl cis-trans isomerase SlyD